GADGEPVGAKRYDFRPGPQRVRVLDRPAEPGLRRADDRADAGLGQVVPPADPAEVLDAGVLEVAEIDDVVDVGERVHVAPVDGLVNYHFEVSEWVQPFQTRDTRHETRELGFLVSRVSCLVSASVVRVHNPVTSPPAPPAPRRVGRWAGSGTRLSARARPSKCNS